ncbi:hypothetical protein RCC89_00395 [Cytophagaceae bacterium ABcell3]|nr:hypothetical protein RCC89_00395 [Cytophagaceae bacterium ABcell3]
MKQYYFSLCAFLVFLASCSSEGGEGNSATNEPREEIIDIEWKGEALDFTRLRNGKIPGGEVTQMWAESDDYESNLSIRWGQTQDRSGYQFDEPPSVMLRIHHKGEQLNYRPVEPKVLDLQQEDDRVYRVEGSLEMEPANSAARSYEDGSGGLLRFVLQK